jgi:predicted transcriptional regulator
MHEHLFGSTTRVNVLIFLYTNKEGYAREISLFYDTDLNQVQKQLERLEEGGILVSKKIGKTILYAFDSRYTLLPELNALIERMISLKKRQPARAGRDLDVNRSKEEKKAEGRERMPASVYQSYDPDMVD